MVQMPTLEADIKAGCIHRRYVALKQNVYLAFFFFSCLAAFFSFMVLAGFFLSLFFESRLLLISISPSWPRPLPCRELPAQDYAYPEPRSINGKKLARRRRTASYPSRWSGKALTLGEWRRSFGMTTQMGERIDQSGRTRTTSPRTISSSDSPSEA